jgi:hypothetical protein
VGRLGSTSCQRQSNGPGAAPPRTSGVGLCRPRCAGGEGRAFLLLARPWIEDRRKPSAAHWVQRTCRRNTGAAIREQRNSFPIGSRRATLVSAAQSGDLTRTDLTNTGFAAVGPEATLGGSGSSLPKMTLTGPPQVTPP